MKANYNFNENTQILKTLIAKELRAIKKHKGHNTRFLITLLNDYKFYTDTEHPKEQLWLKSSALWIDYQLGNISDKEWSKIWSV